MTADNLLNNPHQVLGLAHDATPEVVRQRYLQLVRQYPPEKFPIRFQEINQAYQYINDPLAHADAIIRSVAVTAPDLGQVCEEAARQPPRLSTNTLLALGNPTT